jgi:hypothetical protein
MVLAHELRFWYGGNLLELRLKCDKIRPGFSRRDIVGSRRVDDKIALIFFHFSPKNFENLWFLSSLGLLWLRSFNGVGADFTLWPEKTSLIRKNRGDGAFLLIGSFSPAPAGTRARTVAPPLAFRKKRAWRPFTGGT